MTCQLIIVTPTEVFRVKDKLPKPDHIIWNILTREKFNQIPILRELQFKEQKAGKNVQLKDENADQVNGNTQNSEDTKAKVGKNAKRKLLNGKKKPVKDGPKSTPNNGDTSNTKTNKEENSESQSNGKPKKQKQYPATVSVFVGKIPRGTRVKELKEVIIAKGVKPVNILWKGGKGYALVYCEKKDVPSSEELFEKLKNLTIGENALNVEPDKRVKQLKDIITEEGGKDNGNAKIDATNGTTTAIDANKNPSTEEQS